MNYGRHAIFVTGEAGEARVSRRFDDREGAERAPGFLRAAVPEGDLLPLEVLPVEGSAPGGERKKKSLADYSRGELGRHYRRLVGVALHFQEFAELPGPTEESLRKNEERLRRERAKVAVVRGMALARWPDAAEEAFRWPWRYGYEEALADAEAYRAEAARAGKGASGEGPEGRAEDRP